MLAFAFAIPMTVSITLRISIVSTQTWIFWVGNANTQVRFSRSVDIYKNCRRIVGCNTPALLMNSGDRSQEEPALCHSEGRWKKEEGRRFYVWKKLVLLP
ncbi:hypothetical protein BC008_22825 [Mastigocoleus testarum BC008]|uniref:Uncharacterized protein n=1 Tax=Mastigocoleus testarum BC008 TaxID=371196 RepID=A0A0V7ZN04_9CYAN|nr:hypothetical protein BC008_22825 [Mastigocoleus testarum BC008]